MTLESLRSIFSFSSRSLVITCLCLLGLALAGAAGADGPCDGALPLDLSAAQTGYGDDRGTVYRLDTDSLDTKEPRWLIVEARRLGPEPGNRPTVELLDARCRPLAQTSALSLRRGRHVRFVSGSERLFARITVDEGPSAFRVDAWLGEERDLLAATKNEDPDPVPDEPVDEWDELRFPGTAGKDGDEDPNPVPDEPVDEWDELRATCGGGLATKYDDEDPDPVPDEPVDEWDELRAEPCGDRIREIQGMGVMLSTAEGAVLQPWCSWAGRPELLGTLTCARRLSFEHDPRPTLRRLPVEGPEMLAVELERGARITADGARLAAIYDAAGRRQDPDRPLGSGLYFLEIHDADEVYGISLDR